MLVRVRRKPEDGGVMDKEVVGIMMVAHEIDWAVHTSCIHTNEMIDHDC